MIRTAKVIFCDEEHGTGDMTFPDIDGLDAHQVKQHFIEPKSTRELRRLARLVGWRRINGGDYCPSCTGKEPS